LEVPCKLVGMDTAKAGNIGKTGGRVFAQKNESDVDRRAVLDKEFRPVSPPALEEKTIPTIPKGRAIALNQPDVTMIRNLFLASWKYYIKKKNPEERYKGVKKPWGDVTNTRVKHIKKHLPKTIPGGRHLTGRYGNWGGPRVREQI